MRVTEVGESHPLRIEKKVMSFKAQDDANHLEICFCVMKKNEIRIGGCSGLILSILISVLNHHTDMLRNDCIFFIVAVCS